MAEASSQWAASEWQQQGQPTMTSGSRALPPGHRLAARAGQRLRDLRNGLQDLRLFARQGLAVARDWRPERPLKVVAGFAAAAFLLGVALRIRREQ